jgi:hypothetical protein
MAATLQHKLDDECSVQGLVKPGADLAAIIASEINGTEDFSKQDLVIVWGGINDVSRNETDEGLIQIRNFVNKNNHTNILVMNLPNRRDLEVTSSVNHEIRVFNGKLSKQIKLFNHVYTFEMNFERDHHPRHGLHLNAKGKDYSVKLIRTTIKNIFNISTVTPIIMNWKEIHEVPLSKNSDKTRVQMGVNPETVNKEVETVMQTGVNIKIVNK